ncbi:MAG: tRNA (adenosine(37)-N6)-threonylcarbamoyltransferase complex transferase subunit TsaD [Deltaproteobacteria bacterium]|nr:tRNA (adenosine(37)-N6)-threonylcarbamoyltransferase complex transferase subunit TsaD [Deltaproteobacteria bacterium]
MAAAVLRGEREILSNVIHEQADVHQPYGGVVPELASRDHVRAVSQVTQRALAEAGIGMDDLQGIAVTAGPGLVGSLLVGLNFGKALAYRHGLPFVGVHHLAGHIASASLGEDAPEPPYIGLVVSGGHTALYRFHPNGSIELLGQTRDDAVGEAFDKVANLLGLPFPGGPSLAKVAQSGRADAVAFPRPMLKRPGLDFSYSGLKTAVAIEVEGRGELSASDVADIAASFEMAAVESLIVKTCRAMREQDLNQLVVVGGVSANACLRREMARVAKEKGFQAVFPPLSLSTDNAVMIAAAGGRLLREGKQSPLGLNAFSRVPLEAMSE